jgi:hypothetical protein
VGVSCEHRSARREADEGQRLVTRGSVFEENDGPKVLRHRFRVDTADPATAQRDVSSYEIERSTNDNGAVQRAVLAVLANDCEKS